MNTQPELETVDLQMAFHLPGQLADCLLLLLKNKFVTVKMIEEEHHVGSTAKVIIHRLRGYLKNDVPDVEIECIRGVGYWLNDEARNRILKEAHENLPKQVTTSHASPMR